MAVLLRICLVGDTHGFVPGLEAALEACARHAPDLTVHCGDFLTTPFSPDPPAETINLLRSRAVHIIYGNNEAYLRDWGTPRWESTVAQRRRRPDSPDHFLPLIGEAQAAIRPADLEWLRSLPQELVFSAARRGDVYVCHGMPGNPFATIWDTDPVFTPKFTPLEIKASLSREGAASADLILCGHVHRPLLLRISLPNQRTALVVRGSGYSTGNGHEGWRQGICTLTNHARRQSSHALWDVAFETVPFRPRDPTWTEDRAMRGL